MADTNGHRLPSARRDGPLVQAIDDEVLVYDTERHKAHCLNRTAADVWEHCDGQTTVADVARRLTRELGTSVDDAVVWLAVEQLQKAHLLTETPQPRRGLSRRDVLKRLGVAAAVALPLVTTVRTPTAAQGASCAHENELCGPSAGGLPCCPGEFLECIETSSEVFTCED